jgi:hypothetical protein
LLDICFSFLYNQSSRGESCRCHAETPLPEGKRRQGP